MLKRIEGEEGWCAGLGDGMEWIKLYIYSLKSGENSIDEDLVALVTLMARSTSGQALHVSSITFYLFHSSLPERSCHGIEGVVGGLWTGGGAKGNIGPGSTREEGVRLLFGKMLLLDDGKIGMRYDGIECVGV
ncbi:hypothetical protein CEXT_13041 [Caerostris extrusa]|uniref:Uncharacterized protein n=1 Tax=Caerostris extrusa TaxID=172846 RepID=A0AAV4VCA5_CAEEX|nr:hypothetical protein CEXT_13041 [Caerostris extrusa]